MPDTSNGRVTLAVLQNDVQHLRDEVCGYHEENRRQSQEMEERCMRLLEDHEQRIRAVEGSRSRGAWADVGAYLVAIGAFIAGLVKQ